MKRIFLAAALCASLSAMATQPGNNGGGNGGCGVGQQTNGCGGSTTPGNGGAGGAGGHGGAGGAGGSAAAIAAAQARAEARASAIAAQQQAQQQSQTSRNTNRNTVKTNVTNTNTVTGGPVNVSVTVPATDKAAAPQETVKETAAKEPAAAQKADTVVVDNDQTKYPVSTAYAAPLTSSPETCMGSSSGGVQGASFGVSIASTWESVKCDRRMFARSLHSLGKVDAALAVLCLEADVKAAMEAAGEKCPNKKADAKRAESILNGETVSQMPKPYMAGG